MIKISEVNFPDTTVMYVDGDEAKPIPEQAKKAFNTLEDKFTSFGVTLTNLRLFLY